MRFGERDLLRDNLLPIVTKPFAALETAMPDPEAAKIRKGIKRPKYPRLVNVLKNSVVVTTINKRILGMGVNLTVGKPLASAPALERLGLAISEDEAVKFCDSTFEAPKARS